MCTLKKLTPRQMILNNLSLNALLFLIDNNCLGQFLDNCITHRGSVQLSMYAFKHCSTAEVISYAFVWADTPEGHRYWENLYGKYVCR